MRFVGQFAIDGGGNDLNSRMTHPMSFEEVAEWYRASSEYFAMMVKYDASIHEVFVRIYDADTINSITCEPITQRVFRP